jgi:hypothetical protein
MHKKKYVDGPEVYHRWKQPEQLAVAILVPDLGKLQLRTESQELGTGLVYFQCARPTPP